MYVVAIRTIVTLDVSVTGKKTVTSYIYSAWVSYFEPRKDLQISRKPRSSTRRTSSRDGSSSRTRTSARRMFRAEIRKARVSGTIAQSGASPSGTRQLRRRPTLFSSSTTRKPHRRRRQPESRCHYSERLPRDRALASMRARFRPGSKPKGPNATIVQRLSSSRMDWLLS